MKKNPEVDQFCHLNPNEINVGQEHQPRLNFDLAEQKRMIQSVRDYGILNPVLVRKDGDTFVLVAGESRLRAAKEVGLETVPCIIVDGDPYEIPLVENIVRSDLSAFEEAQALLKLKLLKKYTGKEIAAIIGRSEATVSEIMSINRLPESVKDILSRDNRFTRAELLPIAKAPADKMVEMFEKLLASKDAEDGVLTVGDDGSAPAPTKKSPVAVLQQAVEGLIKRLNAAKLDDVEGEALVTFNELLRSLHALIGEKLNMQVS